MPIERRLLLVAYPASPDPLFEEAVVNLKPPSGWRVGRFRNGKDVLDFVENQWASGTVAIKQLDLFAHGRPGVFSVDQFTHLFHCHAMTFSLIGLEKHLTPDAVVRFLGCRVAEPETRGGWTFDPVAGLKWVSSQLGGLRVDAPTVDITQHSFDESGFGDPPAGIMASSHT
jgi:hypothetical protein